MRTNGDVRNTFTFIAPAGRRAPTRSVPLADERAAWRRTLNMVSLQFTTWVGVDAMGSNRVARRNRRKRGERELAESKAARPRRENA